MNAQTDVSMWARAVAPLAEWVAKQLWSRQRKPSQETAPPTRLTQRHKREAKGIACAPSVKPIAQPHSVCRTCGKNIRTGTKFCATCAVPIATEHIKEAARASRDRAHSAEARAKRSKIQRHLRKVQADWSASDHPAWLTESLYLDKIQPALAGFSNSKIANCLGISSCSASQIRSGKLRPHPRHWRVLAKVVGVEQ